jgi:chromate transporter
MPNTSAHSVLEVFLVFLKLGMTSFGGPVAHIGYFRAEVVERRKWLDEQSYSDLVALCQFLPGPASSKVGIGLGLRRAGWLGGLAAWTGFTAPSALALILFAYGVRQWAHFATSGALHGLKVVAVAVVAQAVWGMAKTLCPDRTRAGLAIGAALIALLLPTAWGQGLAIILGAIVGRLAIAPTGALAAVGDGYGYGVSKRAGAALLLVFVGLLAGLPILAAKSDIPMLDAISAFYRAGALVFGGGHVVLPLLQASVVQPGWVDNDIFLAGYGAAQAVPGPLFTFAAFLGAAMQSPPGDWLSGVVMLVAIFAPGFLLVVGATPFWESLRHHRAMRQATAGINSAVVGVLAAALYDPVWTSAIHTHVDLALALAAFGLLMFARLSPVLVVVLAAVIGALLR